MECAPGELLHWLGAIDGLFVLQLQLIGGAEGLLVQARVPINILPDLGDILGSGAFGFILLPPLLVIEQIVSDPVGQLGVRRLPLEVAGLDHQVLHVAPLLLPPPGHLLEPPPDQGIPGLPLLDLYIHSPRLLRAPKLHLGHLESV